MLTPIRWLFADPYFVSPERYPCVARRKPTFGDRAERPGALEALVAVDPAPLNRRRGVLMELGYALSSEEHRPLDLVRNAARPEEAGQDDVRHVAA
jgi:hypothetical protein